PITLGNKTVIPLVKVSVGFGAGGGQMEKQIEGANFGGGGGGGAKIEPAAFIVIDGDKISLLTAKAGKYDTLMETVPALIGKLIDMKTASSKEKNTEDS
ncbi:MAG: GerW family sporulation protein, partial [candidate division Zixibacteria bacterium]|nr:GerW family sporulation protein [candidate division Zixibacteria bacterium]